MPEQRAIYRLTRQAEADLKGIYHYTRRTWGKAQAAKYTEQIGQCFVLLAERPHSGRKREDLKPPGLRSFVQGSHVIFYKPKSYGVLIVRLLHGNQDVRRQLGNRKAP
jgi:toxin ParE1/3/4